MYKRCCRPIKGLRFSPWREYKFIITMPSTRPLQVRSWFYTLEIETR
jgi:hypothetical protein